jgi:hypothetical protein
VPGPSRRPRVDNRRYPEGVTDTVEPGEILASTAEREAVAAWLGFAFQEGRLDLAEYDRRVAEAYVAQARGQLERLTVDLPRSTRPVRPAAEPVPVRVPTQAPSAEPARDGPWLLVALGGAALFGGVFTHLTGSVVWLVLLLALIATTGALGWVLWDPYGHRGRQD